MTEYPTHEYQHVQTSGLPHQSGKYFLIMIGNQLLFTELEFENGIRSWQCYTTGGPVNESYIRMWKRVG